MLGKCFLNKDRRGKFHEKSLIWTGKYVLSMKCFLDWKWFLIKKCFFGSKFSLTRKVSLSYTCLWILWPNVRWGKFKNNSSQNQTKMGHLSQEIFSRWIVYCVYRKKEKIFLLLIRKLWRRKAVYNYCNNLEQSLETIYTNCNNKSKI